MSRSTIHRGYVASLSLVALTVGIWSVADATGAIDSMTMPWDSLIYAAVIASLVLVTVTGVVEVSSSSAGRWRALAAPPIIAAGFLWWVLIFYGQASSGLGGGINRDVIAEFASQPTYIPVMTALSLLVGLPVLTARVRALMVPR